MMAWITLFLAGILETFWAVSLKYSEGFTKPLASGLTVLGMIASFYLLSLALKTLPLSTAYAVWTGIGTIGTVIVGIIMLKESLSLAQVICVLLIASGIIGLKVLTKGQ